MFNVILFAHNDRPLGGTMSRESLGVKENKNENDFVREEFQYGKALKNKDMKEMKNEKKTGIKNRRDGEGEKVIKNKKDDLNVFDSISLMASDGDKNVTSISGKVPEKSNNSAGKATSELSRKDDRNDIKNKNRETDNYAKNYNDENTKNSHNKSRKNNDNDSDSHSNNTSNKTNNISQLNDPQNTLGCEFKSAIPLPIFAAPPHTAQDPPLIPLGKLTTLDEQLKNLNI